ncbi:MAG: restriction endonuclease subunit S [Oscillospiraceae bacterium]|nr:restriction endonuclease subunit S [Oscillospiraceae bacterium]
MNKTIFDVSEQIGSGITPLRSDKRYWASADFPWIKTEQLGTYQISTANEYISQVALQETSIKIWPPETVLLAMYGEGKTRGSASILMIPATTNQACCNIIVNPQKADYRFLYYWIKHNYEPLRNLATGVRKNLNSDDIKGFPFPDTDITTQKKTADVLSALDDMIQNNTKICCELESMAKTLYDYWFVQFDFPDENGRPYRTSGGAMEWNEQLKREIPKGWKASKVSNIMDIDNNSFDPRKKRDTIMEHYSIPAFDIDHAPAYEPASSIDSGKYAIDAACILTSKLNPHFKRLWDPFCDTKNAICSTEFIVYRPKELWMRPYCYALLNSDAFYAHMVQKAISSTGSRKRIQPDVSASFEFALPDDDTIRAFVALYAPIIEKQKLLYKENRELTKLRDWLLPMLMNGQAWVE